MNLDLACLPGPHGTDPSSLPVSYGFVVFFIGVLVLLWLERPYACNLSPTSSSASFSARESFFPRRDVLNGGDILDNVGNQSALTTEQ